jgi:hypothetical protein
MKTLRRALWVVHIALLAVVTYLAIAAAAHPPTAWPQIAVGASLVAVAAAYALTLYRRGFSRLAPFLFLASSALVVSFVDAGTRAIAKHTAGLGALAQILLAAGLTAAAWYWLNRRSKPLT